MSNRPQAADVPRLRQIAWLIAAGLFLAGCMEAGGSLSARSGAGEVDPRLVVDPEAFTLEDVTLWEGGKTEAGAWIAHPDAQVARRVRITNAETGAQVDAALILRDPTLAGPRVMISTAAARALGLEPGRETQVTVEALRYRTPEEIAAATPAESTTDESATTESATTESATAEASPVAPDEDVGTVAGEPESEPSIEVSSLDDGAETGETPSEAAPPAADAATRLPDGASEVAGAASPDALSAAVEAALDTLDQGDAAPVVQGTANDAAPTPEPGSPVPPPRPVEPATAPSQAIAETAITDGRPFVQAGAFASAAEAEALADRLRDAGMPVEIRPLTLGAKQLSRVLVGPFATVAERDAALKSVRESVAADAAPARG